MLDRNRQVREFFEQRAHAYAGEVNPWITRKRAEFIRGVVRGRVLDVGVGPGLLAQLYSSSPIVACDVSLKMVRLARGRLKNQHSFVVCDAETLPFKGGSFDTVIGSEMIYYLPDPRSFLREVARVLAPGGQIILLWGNSIFNSIYRMASLLRLRPPDPFGLKTPSRAQVRVMLASTFSVRHIMFHGIGLPFNLSHMKANVIVIVSPVNAVVACDE